MTLAPEDLTGQLKEAKRTVRLCEHYARLVCHPTRKSKEVGVTKP